MKYLSCSLRLNNNNITELHDLQKTVSHFLAQPAHLTWLDLSFNKITHIDHVSVVISSCLSFFYIWSTSEAGVHMCVPGLVWVAWTACVVPSWKQHFYSVRGGQAGSAATSAHHHSAWKCHRNQQGIQVEIFSTVFYTKHSSHMSQGALMCFKWDIFYRSWW